MSNKIYVGDVGTIIIVNVKEDITNATTVQLRVQKPNKKTVVWTGEVYDKNKIKYIVQQGDLDVAGEYLIQAYVESPNWKGRGETARLIVYDEFK